MSFQTSSGFQLVGHPWVAISALVEMEGCFGPALADDVLAQALFGCAADAPALFDDAVAAPTPFDGAVAAPVPFVDVAATQAPIADGVAAPIADGVAAPILFDEAVAVPVLSGV